jgi:hypothetical protein
VTLGGLEWDLSVDQESEHGGFALYYHSSYLYASINSPSGSIDIFKFSRTSPTTVVSVHRFQEASSKSMVYNFE